MTKVKSRTTASPQCISLRVDKMIPAMIVVVIKSRRVLYQIAIHRSRKNGKYAPGIKISRISSGSTSTTTAPTAPHRVTRLSTFGIHRIL